jgi:hypothetical protein
MVIDGFTHWLRVGQTASIGGESACSGVILGLERTTQSATVEMICKPVWGTSAALKGGAVPSTGRIGDRFGRGSASCTSLVGLW